jgi:phosphoribosylformylglycinamidine cyclo-ligase
VFQVLSGWAGASLESAEGTWNLGVGMIAVVSQARAASVIAALSGAGIPSWELGRVQTSARDLSGFEQGAKGVDGGAVRLVGSYA